MLIPFIRTLILYTLIIIAIRLMGKRQVGEMQPTELVVTILVSAVASVPMQDINIPLAHGVIPVLTLVGAEVLISVLSLKSLRFRRLLSGLPVIIIQNGEVDQKALKRLRLTLDDILEDLRLKDVYDLRDVRLAQIETNGQLSLLLRSNVQPVTAKMLSLSPDEQQPFHLLVNDGVFLENNLTLVGQTRKWMDSILASNGVSDLSEVFFLCADKNGQTLFARKER